MGGYVNGNRHSLTLNELSQPICCKKSHPSKTLLEANHFWTYSAIVIMASCWRDQSRTGAEGATPRKLSGKRTVRKLTIWKAVWFNIGPTDGESKRAPFA